jgi:hypothetical protein
VYKTITASGMDLTMTKRITKTVLGGFALGESRFTNKIGSALG